MGRSDDIGFAAVARLAGVSPGTVSNTLNRPEKVAAATRERVLAAIEALEFVPNRAASALRLGSSKLIGLVVPETTNPFYAAIASAVSEEAARLGYLMALCVSHDDPDLELASFNALAEQRAAGVLVVPLSADRDRLRRLRMVGARLVLVDRTADPEEGCSVAVDDVRGGRLAVEHLVDSGCSSIVVVNGDLDIPQCADRSAGAHAAAAAAGVQLREVVVERMTVEAGAQAGAALASDPPMGVFCANDQLAVGVITALTDAGVRVPEDVAVVGYGDLEIADIGRVPLTTVEQPKARVGRAAVDALAAELSTDAEQHEHVAAVFAPRLVVRRSAPGRRLSS
ncbi:LacI family DNA-binding transcriptional regulator [Agromyces sp. G08B096]|uniref:LacI family DNA-binding transcriptional regulator n=1 Tax=Agromyces sp. G08B096 TaxID=3156399 RepID=A0AAU7W5F7_9MICO